jgi:hypothetical protein
LKIFSLFSKKSVSRPVDRDERKTYESQEYRIVGRAGRDDLLCGKQQEGLLASEWVNLNGKAALEALFTG